MPRGVASGARYKQRLEPILLHAKALLPNATPLTHPNTVHVRKLATTTEANLHTALKRQQHLPTNHRCCGDRAAFTTDSANSNRLQPHHKAACNNLRHAGPCEGHYATTVHAGLPNHYRKGDDPRPTAFGRTGTCVHMRPSSPNRPPKATCKNATFFPCMLEWSTLRLLTARHPPLTHKARAEPEACDLPD